MNTRILLSCITVFAMLISAGCAGEPARTHRIVFMGDSITDGGTLILLVRRTLADAGRPVPVGINAGVAGDTAKGMRARIERDVLVHRPTLVSLSVGINDVLRGVTLADYERDVTAIADQLKARGVPMLILTTTILGPRNIAREEGLGAYNAFLRRLAKERGYAVADVFARMDEERKAGRELLEADHVHLNFAGYRAMAAAVLEGLGEGALRVPDKLEPDLLPGVITPWKMRAAAAGEPALDEKSVAGLKPDDSWTDYALPETEPMTDWWPEQERRRGLAQSLAKRMGKGNRYVGVARIEAEAPKQVYFNTGADLKTVWLNGRRIYRNTTWTGWHPGKERVAAELAAGANTVVIETGPTFFLSVTDTNDW